MQQTLKAFIAITGLTLCACESDNEVRLQRRELRSNQFTYDAGATAVGDRNTFPIILQSVGPGPVTLFDIQSGDEDHFVVLPTWAETDFDQDGVPERLTIPSGSPETPSQEVVEINFRPDDEAPFRTMLTILSNDTTAEERDENDDSIYRVALRGSGKTPCAEVFPPFHDFGIKPAGGYFSAEITIRNCGEATLTISSFDFDGSTSFFAATATPIYILSNNTATAQIAWIPASNNPESVDVNLVSNAENVTPIRLIGNDCSQSVLQLWDKDGDGWSSCGGDCNDNNENIHPGQSESVNNIDDNCDGQIDEENLPNVDDDGDGITEEQGDCHDNNPDIHPLAEEEANQIDDDCDGETDEDTQEYDDDGDGWSEQQGDCDDLDMNVNPFMEESENGIDDDCDGDVDEGSDFFDDDKDGHSEEDGDCNDADPWSYPDAIEDCDNIDNDCDGLVDEGEENEELGACEFLVERKEPVEQSDNAAKQSCATAVAKDGAASGLFLLAMGLIIRSRRQRQ